MKLHWKILIWMAAGVLVGIGYQRFLDAPAWIGAEVADATDAQSGRANGAAISKFSAGGPVSDYNANKASLGNRYQDGDVVIELVEHRGDATKERKHAIASTADFEAALAEIGYGNVVWVKVRGAERYRTLRLGMVPDCPRDTWLAPARFFADLFMQLLKMLIVPLVLCSIITGVSGLGGSEFGRMGGKTALYYIVTSLLAATTGLFLVNMIQPGVGAPLGLDAAATIGQERENFIYILKRMVPENVFSSLSNNGSMLQIIFFAILFGFFISRVPKKEGDFLRQFFASCFEVMMRLAGFALTLVPYGVFFLVIKVVGETGLNVFVPLLKYMLTVFLGLVIHSMIVLPLILKIVGRVSPLRWANVMSPALLTAFSTSSSAMTLPVTIDSVEKRGGVSNKVSSFVLPLGATVNMDGTAIYECVGVIFLAQYYSSVAGEVLTLGTQVFVVLMAIMASIGAAGIPSAGLVMMFTILSALGYPLEGAFLLLAVDRPLDMCRTMVNIWSDSCGTAIIARSEGEELFSGAAE